MKAVIYARYSSDSQREESIEGQLRECAAFAEKNGITVLRHYIDRAYSAKTDNRPEFQSMIKDSGKRLFDIVIVWKLDRFARNRYDSARYKATLKKNGVKVVSATEIISEGAEGIILESVLEGYAEYYSADLSEKVIRGMTDNALKCKFNGGMMPIGYVIDAEQHFQIDPLTAPFVLTSLCFFLAVARFGRLESTHLLPTAGLPQAVAVEGVVTFGTVAEGLCKGLAQVFFQDNLVTGVVFAVGLLIASWRAWISFSSARASTVGSGFWSSAVMILRYLRNR